MTLTSRKGLPYALAISALLGIIGLIFINKLGDKKPSPKNADRTEFKNPREPIESNQPRLEDRSSRTHQSKNNSSRHGLGSSPSLLVPGFVKIPPDILNLVANGKTDEAVSAAALLWTKDEKLWSRVKSEMSARPLFGASVALSGRSEQERLEGAEHLMQLDPNNLLGYIAALNASKGNKDQSQIDAILARIPIDARLDSYASDARTGMRELMKVSGYSTIDRGLVLSKDPWQENLISNLSGLTSLCSGDISDSIKADRATFILEAISDYRESSPELLPSRVSNRLSQVEELTMRRLPSDFELPNGTSVKDEASRISSQRVANLERERRISEALDTLDSKAIVHYFRTLELHGETEASRWLIGE